MRLFRLLSHLYSPQPKLAVWVGLNLWPGFPYCCHISTDHRPVFVLQPRSIYLSSVSVFLSLSLFLYKLVYFRNYSYFLLHTTNEVKIKAFPAILNSAMSGECDLAASSIWPVFASTDSHSTFSPWSVPLLQAHLMATFIAKLKLSYTTWTDTSWVAGLESGPAVGGDVAPVGDSRSEVEPHSNGQFRLRQWRRWVAVVKPWFTLSRHQPPNKHKVNRVVVKTAPDHDDLICLK